MTQTDVHNVVLVLGQEHYAMLNEILRDRHRAELALRNAEIASWVADLWDAVRTDAQMTTNAPGERWTAAVLWDAVGRLLHKRMARAGAFERTSDKGTLSLNG